MKYYIALIVLLLSINITLSQTPVEDQLGSWFTTSGTYTISNKMSFSNTLQSWHYKIADNFNFLFTSLAVNYRVSNKLTTSFAYGFMDIDSGFKKESAHTYENRLMEQISYKHKLAKLPIDHRFRVEQRFLNKPANNILLNRLRYRLGTKIKLNNALFIRLNNEFLVVVKTKDTDQFTENRAYAALGINIFKSANIQVGYLNRKIKGLDLHRLQLGLFYKIDLRKKNAIKQ
ncbi:hypothetical protein GCM10022291_03850 [Postechiella marina]|uniref:DUF2490 domain-containing protein n=1 Tax=Postechiella marina TaxID=943941 RepID=A0ABP8C095_9FLAO